MDEKTITKLNEIFDTLCRWVAINDASLDKDFVYEWFFIGAMSSLLIANLNKK